MIVLIQYIPFLVEGISTNDSVQATNVTNGREQRMLIPAIQDIVFDTNDMNSNINKSEILVQLKNRSWFENLVHQAMRNYGQMQLNATSKMQSKRFKLYNDTNLNKHKKGLIL